MNLKVLIGMTHDSPTEEHVQVHAIGGYPLKATDPDDERASVDIHNEQELSDWAARYYEIHKIAEIEVPKEHLTLLVYKTIDKTEHMTREEAMAFHDNEPLAGSEFREIAALFLQMHEFVGDVSQGFTRSNAQGGARSREALRIMEARAQALVDNTRNFTRPIRT